MKNHYNWINLNWFKIFQKYEVALTVVSEVSTVISDSDFKCQQTGPDQQSMLC